MAYEIGSMIGLTCVMGVLAIVSTKMEKDFLKILFFFLSLFFAALSLNVASAMSATATTIQKTINIGYILIVIIIIFMVGYFIINFIAERVKDIKRRKMGEEE